MRNKAISTLIMTLIATVSLSTAAFGAAAPIKVTIDSTPVAFSDAAPYIDSNSRTMIPVRAVTESLGANVQWNAEKRLVIIDKGAVNILLPVGKKDIVINGMGKLMDTAATIQDSRTYVPLRFVSEAFGYQVQWFGNSRTVAIYTVPKTVSPEDGAIKFEDMAVRPTTAAEKNLYSMYGFVGTDVAQVTPNQFPITLDTTTVLGVYKDEETKTIVVELYSETPTERDGKTIALFNSNMRIFMKDGRTYQMHGPTTFDAGVEAALFPKWYSRFPNWAAENKQTSKGPTRWAMAYGLTGIPMDGGMTSFRPSQISKIALWEDYSNNGKVLILNVSELPEL